MRFAPAEACVDCTELASAAGTEEVARRLVGAVERHGFAAARIGRLRWTEQASRRAAVLLMERVRDHLVAAGAPSALRLEVDRPQSTYVPAEAATRTLLPHHDGQHCTYLTPSRCDVPDFDPAWRTFGDRGYTTTPAHKLYQAIFVADPGEGLSVTSYYDLLTLVSDVRGRAGLPPTAADPVAAAGWLAENLRRARAAQVRHGCPYPSLGALLGSTEEAFHALSFHHAEQPLPTGSLDRYPQLKELIADCPCGECEGETGRVHCHLLAAVTGCHWRAFRRRYEVLVPSERFDLVLGQNLTLLHGGWAGGRSRLLEPLCLVVDRPEGAGYESWLARAWRRTPG